MLVVSMKEAAILRIGEVDVYVGEIRGGQVKLCVRAPREVRIEHLEPVPGSPRDDDKPSAREMLRSRMGRR